MKKNIVFILVALQLAGCQSGSGGGENVIPAAAPEKPGDSQKGPGVDNSNSSNWRKSYLGQEGHGGDAIVCFSVPVRQALTKERLASESEQSTICTPDGQCETTTPIRREDPNAPIVWRMTDLGRRSIISAKPLEQFLAEKITSKRPFIDELNRLSLEDAYARSMAALGELPAPKMNLEQIHQKLGWLTRDGIASDYGLLDIKDSGFVSENEIDVVYCKELQAVVRRDSQLWYDRDIVSRFDNAGLVLMQMHEEIYMWAKSRDALNFKVPMPEAHRTSERTRQFILKVIDGNADVHLVNQNLKDLGFSVGYLLNQENLPVASGYFMDRATCKDEQLFLQSVLTGGRSGLDYYTFANKLFQGRYLQGEYGVVSELRHNLPPSLAYAVGYTMTFAGPFESFTASINHLANKFYSSRECD